MNAPDAPYPREEELKALIHAARDGSLSAAQGVRLDELLIRDAAARLIYCRFALLAADLEMELAGHAQENVEPALAADGRPARKSTPAPSSDDAKAMPARPRASAPHSRMWREVAHEFVQQPLALAILVLVMIFGGVLYWELSTLPRPVAEKGTVPQPGDRPVPRVETLPVVPQNEPVRIPVSRPLQSDGPVIARLVRSVNASWQPSEQLADGATLKANQKLSLKRGLAEIAFDSGATVILEGPAEIEVGSRGSEVGGERAETSTTDLRLPTSANACSLSLGKLVARVPQQAHGFTVATPTLEIVDLGTEFGVVVRSEVGSRRSVVNAPTSDLRPPTSTRVQVFQGLIEVQAKEPLAQAPAPPIRVKAGEGVTSEPSGQPPRVIQGDAASFVRELPAKPSSAPLTKTFVVDNFSAGKDFSVTSAQVVSFVGDGPLGGHRQIRVGTISGSNTTSLATGTGTLSIQTSGFADTNVSWGTMDLSHPTELNLANAGTLALELEFTAFDVGTHRGGGIYLRVLDGKGVDLQYIVTEKELSNLKARNGGTLSVPLSRFTKFNLFNGEVDGVNFSFDDCDLKGTVTEVRFAVSEETRPIAKPAQP